MQSAEKVNPTVDLIPVFLKEAALDSPAFRASFAFSAEQLDQVEDWLGKLIRTADRLFVQITSLYTPFNELKSTLDAPGLISEAILDHDYSLRSARLFSALYSDFSQQTLRWTKKLRDGIHDPIVKFMTDHLQPLKELRKHVEATQKLYEAGITKYYAMSWSKEPSALREEAFQMYETRKGYLTAAINFGVQLSLFKSHLNSLLLDIFTSESIDIRRIIATMAATVNESANEIDRLYSWKQSRSSAEHTMETDLHAAGNKILKAAEAAACPSRDLDLYQPTNGATTSPPPIPASLESTGSTKTERQGWLFQKVVSGKPARTSWARRWFYVQDGVLGWFAPSTRPPGGVEESDKVGVLLCNARQVSTEDRRFCFEVKTNQHAYILQAESATDLNNWIGVLAAAKSAAVASDSTSEISRLAFAVSAAISPEFASQEDSMGLSFDEASGDRPNQPFLSMESTLTRASTDVSRLRNDDAARVRFTRRLVSGAHPNNQSVNATGSYALASVVASPALSSRKVDASNLAPMTFSSFPMMTGLTRSALLVNKDREGDVHAPGVLIANSWGSTDWGRQSVKGGKQLSGATPPDVSANSKEQTTPQLDDDGDRYPVHFPANLRLQDTQFRLLFPSVSRTEPLLLVFRASWATTGRNDFPGRVYITDKSVYFYGHHLGLVLRMSLCLTEIDDIVCTPHEDFDVMELQLRSGGCISIKTFIEQISTLHKRVSLLVQNANEVIQGSPSELLDELLAVPSEPKEETVMAVPKSIIVQAPRLERVGAGSYEADPNASRDRGLSESTLLNVRFRLPKHPIRYRPLQAREPLYQRNFNLGAKTLFHLLFGEKSDVFSTIFTEEYKFPVTKSMWSVPDRSHPWRIFQISGLAANEEEGKRADEKKSGIGFQYIEHLNDHLCYVVVTRWLGLHFPYMDDFAMVLKFSITHEAKNLCKLSIYGDVEWNTRLAFGRSIISRHAMEFLSTLASRLDDRVVSEGAKLGRSPTSAKAVDVFGSIGAHERSGPNELPPSKRNALVVPPSLKSNSPLLRSQTRWTIFGLLALDFLRLWRWVTGVIFSILQSVGQKCSKCISSHYIMVFMLCLSVGYSVIMTRYAGSASASQPLDVISAEAGRDSAAPSSFTRPVFFSGEGIEQLLSEKHDIYREWVGMAPICYKPFYYGLVSLIHDDIVQPSGAESTRDVADMPVGIVAPLERIATKRQDLVLAHRHLDRLESDVVRWGWDSWRMQEKQRCDRLRKHLRAPLDGTKPSLTSTGDWSEGEMERMSSLVAGWDSYCEPCFG